MNPVLDSDHAEPFDTALLARARAAATVSRRGLVAELEALSGRDPRALLRELAAPFALDVIETGDMLALAPAFELLPLAQALSRHCVLLRHPDGRLTGVLADPFDLDLQPWLGAQARASARQPLDLCLALQSDIQAYLSKQEESARACSW